MKYRILSPIDPYSIASSSETIAAAALVLLTEGRFGLARYDREELILPPFHLSGERGLAVWWRSRRESWGNLDFFSWVDREREAIADALDTVTLEAPIYTDEVDLVLMARNLSREIRASLR